MRVILACFLSIIGLLGGAGLARAQAPTGSPATGTFRPPQLPEGGGDDALVRAVQLRVTYPRQALRDQMQGINQVSFAVAPSGQVCQVRIVHGIRPDLDTAVARAVRQLPRLQPATQHGRPVACLMRAPVTFYIDNAAYPRRPLPAADSSQALSGVTWLPRYRGQVSFRLLAADLLAEYLRRAPAGACALPATGLNVLVTVGPGGSLYDLSLDSDEAERAALQAAFGDQTATAEVANSFSEACLPLLAEAARHLPLLTPAYFYNQPVAMRLLLTLKVPQP